MTLNEQTPTRMTSEERRNVILNSAHQEFSRAGYHGASTARIASLAGCSEPMIYKHFDGKQQMFTLVLDRSSRPIEQRFDTLLNAPGNVFENWNNSIHLILQDPEYANTMRLRMLALSVIDDPSVNKTLTGINERTHQRVVKAIQRAKKEKSVREDVDPEYVFWSWMGLQYASCYRETICPGSFGEMLLHVQAFIDSLRHCDE